MRPVIITTDRLDLLGWEDRDADDFVELGSSPEVVRFINSGRSWTAEEARRFIARQQRTLEERGWCRFALRVRGLDGVAGFCGPGCTFAPDVELGWTLRRDLWGQGLATEAATAVLAFCFGVVGFPRMVSAVDADNHASAAVARRIGMRQDGTLDFEGTPVPRWVADNPLTDPPQDPRYVRDCVGMQPGSSLRVEL